MKVRVTQKNIDAGHCGNSRECPVSLALKDAGWSEPFVMAFGLQDGMRIRVPLPESVREFSVRFDQGKEVKPFEFEVEA